MKKQPIVTKLTPAQEARMAHYRDQWIGVGLSTGRMSDPTKAEVAAAVHRMYTAAKLATPTVVIVPSPLAMALAGGKAAWILRDDGDAVGGAVNNAVRGAVEDAVDGAVRRAVDGAVRGAVDDAVSGAVGGAVRAAVEDAVHGAVSGAVNNAVSDAVSGAVDGAVDDVVRNAVDGAVEDAVRGAAHNAVRGAVDDAVRDAVDDAVSVAVHGAVNDAVNNAVSGCQKRWWYAYQGGNAWPGWDAFLDFFCEIIGDREDCQDHFRRWTDWRFLATVSGFRFLHAKFCLVSELPVKLATEINGRGIHVPHCEDGPSHMWSDGFAIWHWHGVRVPRHVIESPQSITLDEIEREQNAEVKRVMRERYGEGRYLVDTKAKLIDSDVGGSQMDPAPRVLVEDKDGNRLLVGTDGGTGRTYYMPVASTVQTCREAHESLCGFPETEILFGS